MIRGNGDRCITDGQSRPTALEEVSKSTEHFEEHFRGRNRQSHGKCEYTYRFFFLRVTIKIIFVLQRCASRRWINETVDLLPSARVSCSISIVLYFKRVRFVRKGIYLNIDLLRAVIAKSCLNCAKVLSYRRSNLSNLFVSYRT